MDTKYDPKTLQEMSKQLASLLVFEAELWKQEHLGLKPTLEQRTQVNSSEIMAFAAALVGVICSGPGTAEVHRVVLETCMAHMREHLDSQCNAQARARMLREQYKQYNPGAGFPKSGG